MARPTRERRSHYASLSLSLSHHPELFLILLLSFLLLNIHHIPPHLCSSQTDFPTSRQEVESHFLIPTELLGLGILLLLLLELGVLLPDDDPPPSDSLALPLPGSRGAESFGFGGTFGLGGAILLQLLVLWLKRPGGELPSRCIGGWDRRVDGVRGEG